ncbi:MAG: methyltransferase domain-containing protein [Bacteroidetes bacterium]|nr:methyltransferase domain-containing protein [Bacteroidota bacterium]
MNFLYKLFLGDYSQVGLSNKETRIKWVKEALKKVPAGFSILDAGAGEQQYKPDCAHLKYTAQDFAQYDGKGDNKGIQLGAWNNTNLDIICDITNIPVNTSSFDAVLCSEVLHHLPNPVEAVREMVRVLKPGGSIIITAPFTSLTHFSPYHFSTGLNRYFYDHWFKEFNCEIQELNYNGNYFEFLAQEVRYAKDVGEKYAGVKMTIKEKLAQRIYLSFLKKASQKGNNSNELLAFSVFVVATKKR